MSFSRRLMLSALPVLSCALAIGASDQQTTRAALRSGSDRLAPPSIALVDSHDKLVRLADFRGRPIVLNLWATDCGGCRAELPTFVKLRHSYPDKQLAVVGVSLDIMYEDLKSAAEGWARVKPFIKDHGMTYPILLDDGSVEKAFHVTALPATYLIDKAGRVAATYIGVVDAADLEANVKTLLAER